MLREREGIPEEDGRHREHRDDGEHLVAAAQLGTGEQHLGEGGVQRELHHAAGGARGERGGGTITSGCHQGVKGCGRQEACLPPPVSFLINPFAPARTPSWTPWATCCTSLNTLPPPPPPASLPAQSPSPPVFSRTPTQPQQLVHGVEDVVHTPHVCPTRLRYSHQNRHILYDCPTFSGDSGSALVMHDGKVIGMHVEGVNEMKERIARKQTVNDRWAGMPPCCISIFYHRSSPNAVSCAPIPGSMHWRSLLIQLCEVPPKAPLQWFWISLRERWSRIQKGCTVHYLILDTS